MNDLIYCLKTLQRNNEPKQNPVCIQYQTSGIVSPGVLDFTITRIFLPDLK